MLVTHPRRDDDVAAWLKARRDGFRRDTEEDWPKWWAIDDLLDEWRLRADVGASLNDPLSGDP